MTGYETGYGYEGHPTVGNRVGSYETTRTRTTTRRAKLLCIEVTARPRSAQVLHGETRVVLKPDAKSLCVCAGGA
jgi:hypothetical protein